MLTVEVAFRTAVGTWTTGTPTEGTVTVGTVTCDTTGTAGRAGTETAGAWALDGTPAAAVDDGALGLAIDADIADSDGAELSCTAAG